MLCEMTIKNNWKRQMDRVGKQQGAFATELGVSGPFFSRVVTGDCMLSAEELLDAVKILECAPQDIYNEQIIRAIYGASMLKEKLPAQSVRISKECIERIDDLRELTGVASRNALIEKALTQFEKIAREKSEHRGMIEYAIACHEEEGDNRDD